MGSLKVVHCFETEVNTLQILVEATMTANMLVAVGEGSSLRVDIAAEDLYLGICRQLHLLWEAANAESFVAGNYLLLG